MNVCMCIYKYIYIYLYVYMYDVLSLSLSLSLCLSLSLSLLFSVALLIACMRVVGTAAKPGAAEATFKIPGIGQRGRCDCLSC